jgi:hypothetical protein
MSKVKIQGNASGTGVVTLTAPNTNTDRTITLPDSTGSILMTDGDGSALTGLASANQAQVQTHLITTSSQAITAATVTNITGLNATITPSTASKRIKVSVRWSGGRSISNAYDSLFGIKRDATEIGNPATAGSRPLGITSSASNLDGGVSSTTDIAIYSYIDSPATTSAITYYATYKHATSGLTLYNQRVKDDSGNHNTEYTTSSITLEEID